MEQEKVEGKEAKLKSPLPVLCAKNCGFFGSSSTSNLCSKCYRDAFLSKTKASIDDVAVLAVAVADEKACGSDGAAKGGGLEEVGEQIIETSGKKPADRCNFCNKRVGLMGFKCRCDDVFCSLHRYSDMHSCLFDYKGVGQNAIANANPVVKADKVDKI